MSPVPWKGPQKLAAFLLSLEPEASAKLISQFSEKEIAEIGSAMSTVDPQDLSDANIGDLHKEFVEGMIKDAGPDKPPTNIALQRILSQALPPDQVRRVQEMIEKETKKRKPFLSIEKLRLEKIIQLLKGEHPQIIAFVCARMSQDTTALILDSLTEKERLDVIRRIASQEKPSAEAVKKIIASLEEKAKSMKSASVGGEEEAESEELYDMDKKLRTLAEILKTVDLETEKSILQELDEKDAELAKSIREFMFTFEDLASVEKKAMQKILMGFDIRVLATALKSVDPAVEANFINNMSKRVQAMLAEERELLEDVTVEEIQVAQNEILKTVRDMIEGGEIQIPRKTPKHAGNE